MAPTSSLSCRVVTTAAATVTRAGTRVHSYLAGALSRRWVCDTVVTLAYVGITVLFFHKLMLHIGDSVLFEPNDESAGIRLYWGAEFQGENPFTQRRDTLNGAPEGLPLASAVNIANAVIPGTIWLLHYAVGLTAAANVFLLGGFVLTGVSFYVLLSRLGFHPLASFVAGYALAFNPWMMVRAGAGHHGFMQAWIFPIVVALLLHQYRRRTISSAVLVGLGLALAFYTNSYYGLMAGLVVGVFWIVDFVRQKGWHDRLWCFTLADIAIVTSLIAFLPALIAWAQQKRTVAAGVSNELQHLQNLGAASESYILPSFRHPWLSGITRHYTDQFRVRLVREHPLSGLVVAVARARRSVVGDSAAPRHVRHPGETVLPRLHGGARTGRLPRLAQARNERLRRRRADAVVPGRGVHDSSGASSRGLDSLSRLRSRFSQPSSSRL